MKKEIVIQQDLNLQKTYNEGFFAGAKFMFQKFYTFMKDGGNLVEFREDAIILGVERGDENK